jgi:hypothetical protein
MSPQEKRHGVMARIRTSDLTMERPTLYHLSYPARQLCQYDISQQALICYKPKLI